MAKRLGKRLKSWARTGTKLVLLLLGYFWLGAAYKLIYAQTHDLTRFKNRLPISFYQQQFMLESLLRQTWIFGPDFREYIGTPPALGALFSANPQVVLADYCRQRERELAALPGHYPQSLFVEDALQDAYLLSQGAAYLGLMTGRTLPERALAVPGGKGVWRAAGLPDIYRSGDLARRLADEYPASSQASVALLRLAQMEEQQGRTERSRAIYERITLEYPRSDEAEEAANALYGKAREENNWRQARQYKQLALTSAERLARERFPGKPLPAASAMNILGYHIDLSALELQMTRVAAAQELLNIAARESERLKSLPSLDRPTRRELRNSRTRMERVHSETWVANLYKSLKVGVPGPAPRPQEYDVSGRVLIEKRPLSGVEVVLAEAPAGDNVSPDSLQWMARSRYRAISNASGQYQIKRVPAARYWIVAVYTIRALQAKRSLIALDSPTQPSAPLKKNQKDNRFNGSITIHNKPVKLPDLNFKQAVETQTYGEQKPVGKAVRLAWRAWPGATSYRVEVLAPQDRIFRFERRVTAAKKDAFYEHPVLWKMDRVQAQQADCPLVTLAPDSPPEARFMRYDYRIIALDQKGKAVAASTQPLCHFVLAPEATAALLKLRPPVRRQSGQRRRRPRRRPEERKS